MTTLDRLMWSTTAKRSALFAAAIFAVLLGGQAAYFTSKGAPPEMLLDILVPMMVFSTPIVLPLAVSSAMMQVIGTMHRDGQFQALAAAGISPLRVLRGVWPTVLTATILAGVLSHLVLPPAMERIHDSVAQLAEVGIDMRIAQRRAAPVPGTKSQLWANSSERGRMRDAMISGIDDGVRTVIFAPSAQLKRHRVDTDNDGVLEDRQSLELHRPRMLRLAAQGSLEMLWSDTSLVLPLPEASALVVEKADAWPTSRLIDAVVAGAPASDHVKSWEIYNGARLALWTRMLVPIAVIALSVFAAGAGLTLGRSEALLALALMAVMTVATIYPATAYTMAGVAVHKLDPLWIMGPSVLAVLSVGCWLIYRSTRTGRLLPRRGA